VSVAEPGANTLEVISRQPWSPTGDQVVVVRVAFPGQEDRSLDGVGIYAGPPGKTEQIVSGAVYSSTYPVWQPSVEEPPTERQIDLLYTNDLEGHLRPWENGSGQMVGGLANLAGQVQQLCAQGRPTLLVDAGDTGYGTPLANASDGALMVDVMNMMHYDAWTLGNHEFDGGQDNAQALIARANFASLGANVLHDGVVWDDLQSSTILDVGGLRVGLLGLSHPDTPGLTGPTNVAGLTFADPITVARRVVPRLRERSDLVIVLRVRKSITSRIRV
jgi:2',3'-cyclic-nucleotide 2'-phosphodiesterase (5'-nucleotidase family)